MQPDTRRALHFSLPFHVSHLDPLVPSKLFQRIQSLPQIKANHDKQMEADHGQQASCDNRQLEFKQEELGVSVKQELLETVEEDRAIPEYIPQKFRKEEHPAESFPLKLRRKDIAEEFILLRNKRERKEKRKRVATGDDEPLDIVGGGQTVETMTADIDDLVDMDTSVFVERSSAEDLCLEIKTDIKQDISDMQHSPTKRPLTAKIRIKKPRKKTEVKASTNVRSGEKSVKQADGPRPLLVSVKPVPCLNRDKKDNLFKFTERTLDLPIGVCAESMGQSSSPQTSANSANVPSSAPTKNTFYPTTFPQGRQAMENCVMIALYMLEQGDWEHLEHYLTTTTFHNSQHPKLQELWFYFHYEKWRITRGMDTLTPPQKYRIRARNPLPPSISSVKYKSNNMYDTETRQKLNMYFKRGQYADRGKNNIEEIIKDTGLSPKQVKNYFKNKRCRMVKNNK